MFASIFVLYQYAALEKKLYRFPQNTQHTYELVRYTIYTLTLQIQNTMQEAEGTLNDQ